MKFAVTRGAWGLVLLAAPDRALGFRSHPSLAVRAVVRLLGARQVGEAVVLAARRGAAPRWPVVVDVTHGASMLLLAWREPRFRREALRSALVAALLASSSEAARQRS